MATSNAASSPDEARIEYLTTLVGRLYHRLERVLEPRIQEHGLTLAEFTVLLIVGNEAGLSNAELARRLRVRPQSIHDILTSLERRELVERHQDDAHRRILRTHTTKLGEKTLRECNRVLEEVDAQILDGFGGGEMKGFRTSVERAVLNLDDLIE